MKYHGTALGKLLIQEGLCPTHASNVELHVPADGALFLRYDVFVETDDLRKLSRVMLALADNKPLESKP